ncbi:MAG: hypothetical protein HZC23_03165 [Rhodocyclales bacterium]|nr:hypothetical protein [Rhodocyclales bacterium]
MKSISLFLAGLAAGLFAFSVHAQPGPGGGMGGGMGGMGPGMSGGPRQAAPADCSKTKNPAQCEARQKAREACKDRKGLDYRACMDDNKPAPDCSKARSPERCAAQQSAREACKGKYGPERRQCMRDQRKPPAQKKS